MTRALRRLAPALPGFRRPPSWRRAARPVTLLEAAGQAGGRCRSYFDAAIGGVIDNGNHLVLSGNRAVHDYLARIGARDALRGRRMRNSILSICATASAGG